MIFYCKSGVFGKGFFKNKKKIGNYIFIYICVILQYFTFNCILMLLYVYILVER